MIPDYERTFAQDPGHKFVVVQPPPDTDANYALACGWRRQHLPPNAQVFVDPDDREVPKMRRGAVVHGYGVTVIYLGHDGTVQQVDAQPVGVAAN